ncbi:class I SAM-dependent methyltransferase [Paenibacillus ginsengarvi]|uniref:Class I SAM-dependent methyltransferase n=1 Tax=Paenibacillus ginsengarvi TaxID=400777 RepID=A0A3B0CKD9_9BACL|nr:class I SAM-dependent methyltransferase [Paenibacillus ginsengarvi]RKN85682.1 class I SAM-dependent methyltransferase [Paenibacillus ginsengarvi]
MSFSYYGELCTEVYDLTKRVGHSFGGEIEYYRNRLHALGGTFLEAMAGSGRVLIPLLESGLRIDGVDSSPEMLASCRKRCDERGLQANLYEASLQELALPDLYDAIIIPGGSFLLIEKRDESIAVLKRLFEHLKPGGRLLLDLFLPETFDIDKGKVSTSTYQLTNGDTITMEGKLVETNLFEQYQVSYLKYEKWRAGKLLQTELQRFALRWYGIEEFKLVLESVGFTDIVLSADFEYGKPPTKASSAFVYEAVKR